MGTDMVVPEYLSQPAIPSVPLLAKLCTTYCPLVFLIAKAGLTHIVLRKIGLVGCPAPGCSDQAGLPDGYP